MILRVALWAVCVFLIGIGVAFNIAHALSQSEEMPERSNSKN
jgi:hypothetical protein